MIKFKDIVVDTIFNLDINLSKDEIKDCKIMGGEEFQMREEKKRMLKRRLEKKDVFR